IVVAGGHGSGYGLSELFDPQGLLVDTLGTVYVADEVNCRVIRWTQEAKQGTVIVGGNGPGAGANQFHFPYGLSFDRNGNLYVADAKLLFFETPLGLRHNGPNGHNGHNGHNGRNGPNGRNGHNGHNGHNEHNEYNGHNGHNGCLFDFARKVFEFPKGNTACAIQKAAAAGIAPNT
ncbi:unnamed protein product, partial [Rotaria magnacalcarata]